MGSELCSLRKYGIKASILISLAEAIFVSNIPMTKHQPEPRGVQEIHIHFEPTQLILENIFNIVLVPHSTGRAQEIMLKARSTGCDEAEAICDGSKAWTGLGLLQPGPPFNTNL